MFSTPKRTRHDRFLKPVDWQANFDPQLEVGTWATRCGADHRVERC